MRGADVKVWLLDDGARPEMAALAGRYGSEYLAAAGAPAPRPGT